MTIARSITDAPGMHRLDVRSIAVSTATLIQSSMPSRPASPNMRYEAPSKLDCSFDSIGTRLVEVGNNQIVQSWSSKAVAGYFIFFVEQIFTI